MGHVRQQMQAPCVRVLPSALPLPLPPISVCECERAGMLLCEREIACKRNGKWKIMSQRSMGHGAACSAKKVKQRRRRRRRRQRRRRQQQRRQNQRENNNCYTCFGNARKGWKRALAQHTNNIDDADCCSWLLSGEQRRLCCPSQHATLPVQQLVARRRRWNAEARQAEAKVR